MTTVAELAAEMIQGQIDATNAAIKSLIHPVYNVKGYGAQGDGVTDDTVAFTDAFSAIGADGRGVLYVPKRRFRVTGPFTLPTNVAIISDGGVIYADPSSYVATLFDATGTKTTIGTLTANAASGDTFVTVNTTSGLNVGDLAMIYDTRRSSRHPHDVQIVKSVTATTITFYTPLVADYLTANSAAVAKISGMENLLIRGLTIECASTSDIRYIIAATNVKHIRLEDVRVVGHRLVTSPTSQSAIVAQDAYNVFLKDLYLDNLSGQGNAISVARVGFAEISGCRTLGYPFGAALWQSPMGSITKNELRGDRVSGSRGIKVAGCWFAQVVDNFCSGFDAGVKIEDSGRAIVSDNQCVECGFASDSNAINFSGSFPDASTDLLHVIANNRIRKTTGHGIFLEAAAEDSVIIGNNLEEIGGYGIIVNSPGTIIAKNKIKNWATLTAGSNAIAFVPTNVVIGNALKEATGTPPSFRLISAPTLGDGTVFSNNVATNNAVDPVYSVNFPNVSYNRGNLIKSFGQRERHASAAPVSGTWDVGDVVWNTVPAAGGFIGWVCVTAGTPGTWKTFGAITA